MLRCLVRAPRSAETDFSWETKKWPDYALMLPFISNMFFSPRKVLHHQASRVSSTAQRSLQFFNFHPCLLRSFYNVLITNLRSRIKAYSLFRASPLETQERSIREKEHPTRNLINSNSSISILDLLISSTI